VAGRWGNAWQCAFDSRQGLLQDIKIDLLHQQHRLRRFARASLNGAIRAVVRFVVDDDSERQRCHFDVSPINGWSLGCRFCARCQVRTWSLPEL
jgi:hypothetical protein